ncbi:unnamed protein product, partial [Amoebophrya sp. A25]
PIEDHVGIRVSVTRSYQNQGPPGALSAPTSPALEFTSTPYVSTSLDHNYHIGREQFVEATTSVPLQGAGDHVEER